MATIVYKINSETFEWDEDKAANNLQKHGVTFEEAAQVFLDLEDEALINDQDYILECLDRAIAQQEMESLTFHVPKSVMISLIKVAEAHNVSVVALIRSYIGQCLREDLSMLFSNTVLEHTEAVLSQRLDSDQVSEIMQEIRSSQNKLLLST